MTYAQDTERKSQLTLAHYNFERGLNAHAFFKMRDHERGQDLVQETFMKTWKYLVRGGKIEMMRAFLFHILNHLIVDEYRKRKTTSLDSLLEEGFDPHAPDESETLLNVLDGKAAFLLIARLPLAYQKVMRMRYVQDLSLKEMSLITGKSRNTIAVQAHRGLEKLKLLYKFTY